MTSTQIITWAFKTFSHLKIPTKYQYLIDITIFVSVENIFFDTNMDVDYEDPCIHLYIYQSTIGCYIFGPPSSRASFAQYRTLKCFKITCMQRELASLKPSVHYQAHLVSLFCMG